MTGAIRRYGRSEIERFLEEVDAALDRPVTVVLVGWSAAMLGYDAPGNTQDIDTWTTVGKGLEAAVERARQRTGLPMPFGKAGVADPPYGFESRLGRTMPHLKKLAVMVPDKHDIALMKAGRGLDRDIEAVWALHRRTPLDCDLLVRRYQEEMVQAIGDPRRLRGNFLALIERLFPDRAQEVARRLEGREVDPGRPRPGGGRG